jgi:pyruvate decarboxylase
MADTTQPSNGVNGTADTIPLGLYLWTRIKQVGVNRIFGVPGDFNLTLLDHIYDVEGLEWVGNTNELNAAYAADGYARTMHGAGCLVTTHGVGELSALNGIAGSMTEQVRVIHVVGQTSRMMQEKKMMIHHSIGPEPDHQVFNKASVNFRVAAAELTSEKGATEEIDRVLRECYVKSGPVYIFVPIDIVDLQVPAAALKQPLDLSPPTDAKLLEAATEAVLSAIYESKNPAIFVDCLVDRHNAIGELETLISKLSCPIFATNMGKGIIDETHPNYLGVYNGMVSSLGIAAAIEQSDCVLIIGSLASDTNSGGFTRKIQPSNAISLDAFSTTVKGTPFSSTPLKPLLTAISTKLDASRAPSAPIPTLPPRPKEDDHAATEVTQSYLWPRLAAFLQPHDILLGETGTAAFGIPDSTFPVEKIQWLTQTYYGSIGWATPAALGCEFALLDQSAAGKRPRGRTLLVTGDGSMMLTAQEIGNMVKQNLSPLIFIINNAGYTIERVIHGAKQSYNDIVPFAYQHLLPFFNMSAEQAKQNFHRAENKAQLEEILDLERVRDPVGWGKGPQVVEIMVDMMDVPWRLATQVGTRGPEAVAEMREAGFKVRDMQHGDGFWA